VPFAYGALTRCGGPFQGPSARHRLYNSPARKAPLPAVLPSQPHPWHRLCLPLSQVNGLGSSPFARRY
jgi:hypothetical protein